MTERYKFSVAYEPAILQSAVRAYMWKSLTVESGWVSTAAVFLVVVAASFALFTQDLGLASGLVAAAIAALVMVAATYGWMAWRGRKAKLAMMQEPRAVFMLSDEAVEVKTDRGAGRFDWRAIRQIWKFKRVWLLMMDRNRFVTLPLADAPAEALQFLDKHIEPRPLGAA